MSLNREILGKTQEILWYQVLKKSVWGIPHIQESCKTRECILIRSTDQKGAGNPNGQAKEMKTEMGSGYRTPI